MVQLSAGGRFACVILSGAQSRCWGLNTNGQLGIGSDKSKTSATAMVGLPSGGPKIAQLACGWSVSLVLYDDGTLYGTGKGLRGTLRYICENGFEHHVAVNPSRVAAGLDEAFRKYLGWEVHHHR